MYKNKRGRRRLPRQKIYHYFLDALVFIISRFLFPEKKDPEPVSPPVIADHICEAGVDPDGWETICSVCRKRKAKTERVEVLQRLIDGEKIYFK